MMASTDPPPPLLDEGLQTANCYSKLLPGELPLLLRHLPHSITAPSSVRSKSANNFEGCHKRGGERKRNERRMMRRLNQIIIGRVVTKPGPNGRKWVGRSRPSPKKAITLNPLPTKQIAVPKETFMTFIPTCLYASPAVETELAHIHSAPACPRLADQRARGGCIRP
jgi:hypothetical protein